MADPEKAIATQLANIEKRTGRTLDELAAVVRGSGLTKHGEIRALLMSTLGMGYGDANTLVHHVLRSDGARAAAAAGLSAAEVVDALYTGPKAALRPIHDRLLDAIQQFGGFETQPKKTYVSLRRKKQFAMIGPATNTRVEVGADRHHKGTILHIAPSRTLSSYSVAGSRPALVRLSGSFADASVAPEASNRTRKILVLSYER